MRTRLCQLLGLDVPIICAPMGPDITSPELAAAVSNAGGLGVVSFGALPSDLLRERVRRVRALTDRPFGVNFSLHFSVEAQVSICIEERVPVLSFFWGDASPWVDRIHAAGLKVMDQVGSVDAARRSASAGVDLIVAQGAEAGGHVAGTVSTLALVPVVVDAVAPLPVVAAGGIASGRGVAAALSLGADGVVMGTRFLATPEANAHEVYKRRVLAATEADTVRTTLFGGMWPHAPHRVIRTRFVEEWLPNEDRGSEERPDEPVIGETVFAERRLPVRRFFSVPPSGLTTGEIESMALAAGESVGQVRRIMPAADVVVECIDEARRVIGALAGL